MKTECVQTQLEFQELADGRRVVVDFEGGHITSDAGGLLLRQLDVKYGLLEAAAKAFSDRRAQGRIEHSVVELLRQRVFGIALGYEDLNDHDLLRHDPVLGLLAGKSDVTGSTRRRKRDRGKACAGKSTLNRMELSPDLPVCQASRYHKITFNSSVVDDLLVDHFLGSFREVPRELILDLDATDDPAHGRQEGIHFHGYYDCYCYLPLYVFCGDFLLCARLRSASKGAAFGWENEIPRIVERIRSRFPQTRIIVRGDSSYGREDLMSWCESKDDVHFAFGLQGNKRLLSEVTQELAAAKAGYRRTGSAYRCWKDFSYRTLESWSRERRVVCKAEWLEDGEEGEANARFVVTSLGADELSASDVYEGLYCARGEMENRIKEQQLDLFADRTSTSFMASNQLRLYLASLAYVMLDALRRDGLHGTEHSEATCATMRRLLLKAGAQIRVSVRRVLVSISTGWPLRDLFVRVARNVMAPDFG